LRSSESLGIVEKAISKFIGRGVESLPSLVREIEGELAITQSASTRELVIVSPTSLSLEFVTKFGSPLSIEGQKLTFQEQPTLSKAAEDKIREFFLLASRGVPPLTNLTWISGTIYARDAHFAFAEFLGLVDRFFALVNYECVGNRVVPLFKAPLTELRPSRSVFAFEKGKMIQSCVADVPETYVSGANPLEPNRLKEILNTMYYPLVNGSAKNLLCQALEVYSSAVTEQDAAFAFLKFWIVVETIAGVGDFILEKDLKERVRHYFINKSPAFESEIEVTLQKRNLLVHDGELGSIAHHDLVFSKVLADLMLGALWKFTLEKRSISTIRAIFENGGLPEKELDAIKDAIEYLKTPK
jgi:hypothetical protein